MRATITVLHLSGVQVAVLVEDLAQVDTVIAQLLGKGYRATLSEWPKGPDNLPLCLKHGVSIQERNRQGDTWHSHRIVHPATGEELYCRGMRHGPAERDGFLIDVPG